MSDVIKNSKNLIFKSHVVVEGNLHVGDIYHIGNRERQIPLQLNSIPFVNEDEVIGREKDITCIKDLILNDNKPVLVSGINGIGKSTLIKFFLKKHRKEFNYIAWVNSNSEIIQAMINDIALIDSLSLRKEFKVLSKSENFEVDAFKLIINRMRQLKSNDYQKNLLIVENMGSDLLEEDTFNQILISGNWKVLVTSTSQIERCNYYELGIPEFNYNTPIHSKEHIVIKMLKYLKSIENEESIVKENSIKNEFVQFITSYPDKNSLYSLLSQLDITENVSLLKLCYFGMLKEENFMDRYWISIYLGRTKMEIAKDFLIDIKKTEQNIFVKYGIDEALINFSIS